MTVSEPTCWPALPPSATISNKLVDHVCPPECDTLPLQGGLGHEWKPAHLGEIITREVSLDDMDSVFNDMMESRSLGRTVVKIGDLEE